MQSIADKKNEPEPIEPIEKTFNTEESSLTNQTYERFLTQAFQNSENYEIFYQALDGEKITNFEVFRNYVVINLFKDGKEFFKSNYFIIFFLNLSVF